MRHRQSYVSKVAVAAGGGIGSLSVCVQHQRIHPADPKLKLAKWGSGFRTYGAKWQPEGMLPTLLRQFQVAQVQKFKNQAAVAPVQFRA